MYVRVGTFVCLLVLMKMGVFLHHEMALLALLKKLKDKVERILLALFEKRLSPKRLRRLFH